jgi:hypothetical protein
MIRSEWLETRIDGKWLIAVGMNEKYASLYARDSREQGDGSDLSSSQLETITRMLLVSHTIQEQRAT